MKNKLSLGLLGARGFVGKDFLQLLAQHPGIDLQWVSSRQLVGKDVSEISNAFSGILIEAITPEDLAKRETDIVVLSLPNNVAAPYVKVLLNKNHPPIIIDLSADYRFAENWHYMIPEIIQQDTNFAPQGIKLISNPGCYATAMQLILQPLKNQLAGTPSCFGVSGYSGAGTSPSPKNDPKRLKDNLLPYALTNHLHEKEVSFHFGMKIQFTPHVASFFRGINMTVHCELQRSWGSGELLNYFSNFYKGNPLINTQKDIPEVRDIQNTPNALIGGFALSDDGRRATIICCLDNLLKGAASQALQNVNLVCGFDELSGINTTELESTL